MADGLFSSILNPRSSILDLGELMGSGIFITGTNTGVGKTLVAASLAVYLRDRGYRVGVMKPVETGCPERNGMLIPEDAARLKEASGCAEAIERICPYRFSEPLAPSIAAERANRKIDVDLLLATYGEISSEYDITLVEGAGGLMVPLLPSYTYADFARVLKLPLLVVAANKIGVLNHLLLTLEHASCKGLSVLGYVLNRTAHETSLAAETNREVLSGLTGVPCLGDLPFIETIGTRETFPLDLFEQELNVRLLEPALSQR
jgi:dethiobiotin synthetase